MGKNQVFRLPPKKKVGMRCSRYIYIYIICLYIPINTSPITHTTAIEDFMGKSCIVGYIPFYLHWEVIN